MRTHDQNYVTKQIKQTRNKALAIYIAAITLLVMSYSTITAISVL